MTEQIRALYSVSQLFPTRQLRFFLTAPQPCPYLPERTERKVFAYLPLSEGAAVNDALTLGGFRRSQNIAYRPACPGCDACLSVRVPVARYRVSRSDRRVLQRNGALGRHIVPAEATEEQFELLRRYLAERHAGGGMAGMGWADFVAMVQDTAVRTHMVEYREDGRMVACALVDTLNDAYSLVYSFFDPDIVRRSLGSYIILDHIERARAERLDYVYLGYWVPGSRKMDYKARFEPIEVLRSEGWQVLSAEDRTRLSGG